MFVPFFSKRDAAAPASKLGRRSKRSGGNIFSRDSSTTTASSFSLNTYTSLGSRNATVSSSGGGSSETISSGNPFAGRSAGGATRDKIYGTEVYGSGYPNITGRGTAGRGFPFYFWPVIWSDGLDYLHPAEYGKPGNSSRPGGGLATATFPSNKTGTTLQILSDEDSVTLLIQQITGVCDYYIDAPATIHPVDYNASSSIKPEQAVQYYRASSIVLTLNGYNNTAALSTNESATQVPLSLSSNATNFLTCANTTIGKLAPLVDVNTGTGGSSGALTWSAPQTTGLVGVAWLVWILLAAA